MANSHTPLTRRFVLAQSWPIMLANAAAPIVAIVDTIILGNFATTTELAGIGLGAVIYGIAYWGFGFLRMSTAGLVAQSDGINDTGAIQAHLARAIPLGLFIGLFVFSIQIPLMNGAFKLYTASDTIEGAAATYISARLWGLPATLASIALMGWFVGISRSGRALIMQIVLNAVNAGLSLYFVIGLGWGLYGVGIASAIAEWCGLAVGLALAFGEIRRRGGFDKTALSLTALLDLAALKKLGVTNSNIFIRTMALAFGFQFFGNAAATKGEVFLAGHHILLQFITMIALILDAFAHTAEAVTGSAYGARNKVRFDRAVRLTTEFSALFGILCGLVVLTCGGFVIDFITDDALVRKSAKTYLPYCALAPVIGFPAWQLDGIFIGTTRTREMRNAGLVAVIIYIGAHYLLEPKFGGHGLWMAFLGYYVARAITLAYYVPSINRYLDAEYANQGR